MKLGLFTILFLFLIVPLAGLAQNDTLIINNNYKFKIGVKGLFERSLGGIKPNNVFNYGLQAIYKIGKKGSSIETGIFYITRTAETGFIQTNNHFSILMADYEYNNIHLPIKYRLDKKIATIFIYGSAGIYGEYLSKLIIKPPDNVILPPAGSYTNRKYLFGVTTSVGVEKEIFSKFNFFTEIEMSTQLSSLNYFEPILGGGFFLFRNYGITIGINYKILKH